MLFVQRVSRRSIVCALAWAVLSGWGGASAQPATGTIDVSTIFQTMDGFGGSAAWYNIWMLESAQKEEICDSLFTGLGIDIVRLRNVYGRSDGSYSEADLLNFDKLTFEAAKSRNPSVRMMLNSWSPPAALKDNRTLGGGSNATLLLKRGAFVYDQFAPYLLSSINAYSSLGVTVDYTSIQNEPDYDADWESCRFEPAEAMVDGKKIAGYSIALDRAFGQISSRTKLVGPEVTGIGNTKVQRYVSALNQDQIDVLSYHLYNGGDPGDPDSYIANLQSIAGAYPDKTIWQTEFDWPTPFNTAWLIHNTIVEGRAGAYLHWGLVWSAPSDKALIAINNPWQSSGYTINKYYYYFKQFSKFIHAGYRRVAATINDADIKFSAFVAPDNSRLTAILINKGSAARDVAIDIGTFAATGSEIYRTSASENFAATGALGSGNTLTLPAMSVSTVVIAGVVDTSDTITPPPPPGDHRLHIADIGLTKLVKGPLKQGVAEVLVLDENSNPVSGVTVSIAWTGVVTGSAAGTTDANGIVKLFSANTRSGGTLTVTVTNLARDGYTYAPDENAVTSASISL